DKIVGLVSSMRAPLVGSCSHTLRSRRRLTEGMHEQEHRPRNKWHALSLDLWQEPARGAQAHCIAAHAACAREDHPMKEQRKASELVAGGPSVTASGLMLDRSDRRSFLLGAAGGFATLAAGSLIASARQASAAEPAGPLFAYIGCFTTERRNAKGKG